MGLKSLCTSKFQVRTHLMVQRQTTYKIFFDDFEMSTDGHMKLLSRSSNLIGKVRGFISNQVSAYLPRCHHWLMHFWPWNCGKIQYFWSAKKIENGWNLSRNWALLTAKLDIFTYLCVKSWLIRHWLMHWPWNCGQYLWSTRNSWLKLYPILMT